MCQKVKKREKRLSMESQCMSIVFVANNQKIKEFTLQTLREKMEAPVKSKYGSLMVKSEKHDLDLKKRRMVASYSW